MAINLQKGQKVSLEKKSPAGLGEILVNLNWNSRPVKQGFLSGLFGGKQGIDLDLGCLYELKDGRKGTVQALGNAFGSLTQPPFISLDGDDRTGAAAAGENLRINGNKTNKMCGLVLFENLNDQTFSVEKIVQFYPGHEALDKAFNWGLRWKAGRK